jgi:uncharacterized protein with PQ loop repeat
MPFKLIHAESGCMPALIHKHKRKRVHQDFEPYPHPDKLKNFVDRAIYFVAIFGLIFTIPQITSIWIDNNYEGVSILSWSAYTVMGIFWLLYGYLHKEKPLMVIYSSFIVLYLLIIFGVLVKNGWNLI